MKRIWAATLRSIELSHELDLICSLNPPHEADRKGNLRPTCHMRKLKPQKFTSDQVGGCPGLWLLVCYLSNSIWLSLKGFYFSITWNTHNQNPLSFISTANYKMVPFPLTMWKNKQTSQRPQTVSNDLRPRPYHFPASAKPSPSMNKSTFIFWICAQVRPHICQNQSRCGNPRSFILSHMWLVQFWLKPMTRCH